MKYPISTHNGKEYKVAYGFYFHKDTNDKVIDVLVNLYTTHKRCRIFYGDIKSGKSWHDEYDITGTIGSSTGSIKIPLIINNSRSFGGPGILEHCIVGIQVKAGQFLYKHPTFDAGKWELRLNQSEKENPFSVYCNDILHARFNREKRAVNYIAFMTGERLCK